MQDQNEVELQRENKHQDLSNEFIKVATSSILLFLLVFFNELWLQFVGVEYCFDWVSVGLDEYGEEILYINFDAVIDCNSYCLESYWDVYFFTEKLKFVIYLACLIIQPDFKRVLNVNLWWFYGLFEVTQAVDYRLFFNQLPYMEYFSYFLFTFQCLYVIAYFWRFELEKFR